MLKMPGTNLTHNLCPQGAPLLFSDPQLSPRAPRNQGAEAEEVGCGAGRAGVPSSRAESSGLQFLATSILWQHPWVHPIRHTLAARTHSGTGRAPVIQTLVQMADGGCHSPWPRFLALTGRSMGPLMVVVHQGEDPPWNHSLP